jgi:competence protein ComEC
MQSFLKKHPIYRLLPFQISAILLASILDISPYWLFPILLISLFLLFTKYYNYSIPITLMLLVFIQWEIMEKDYSNRINPDQKYKFSSTVKNIKYTQYSQKITLQIIGEKFNVLLSSKEKINVLPGDTLFIESKFELPSKPRNPGEFNYRKYLFQNDIFFIVSNDFNLISIHEAKYSFGRQVYLLREGIRNRLNSLIDKPYSGVIVGLLLGDKSDITYDMRTRFQKIGVVHILAVSGLHVGFILLILTLVANLIRLSKLFKLLLIVLGLVFYMALTGFPPSVVRAGIMAILYVWSGFREKTANGWNILGVTAFIILLFSPSHIFSAGFILSFSAVSGIFYFYSKVNILDKKYDFFHRMQKNQIMKWLISTIFVSLGAQLGTFLPVSLIFKTIPVWAILGNLIIVPIIGISIISGIVMLFISLFSIPIASIFAETTWGSLWFVDWVSYGLEDLPLNIVDLNSFSSLDIIVIFICIIFVMSIDNKKYLLKVSIVVLLCSNYFLWQSIFVTKDTRFTFLDVGQGDACVIESGGKVILIDAGYFGFGKDYGERVILPYLKYRGIKNIDLVVMTHPHADHIGGLVSIIEQIHINVIWDTFNSYPSTLYHSILDSSRTKSIRIQYPQCGEIYKIGELDITMLYPDSVISRQTRNINNASIVLRVDHTKNSFLFTGDAEEEAEQLYQRFSKFLDVDVVKVGHHGSKTSSTQQVVDKTSAQFAIISCGINNKFNHPSEMIVNRWMDSGARVLRTDINGAVIIESDNQNLFLTTMINP